MSVVRPSSPRAKYLHTTVVKMKSQRLNLKHFLLNPAQVSNYPVWRAPRSQEALWHQGKEGRFRDQVGFENDYFLHHACLPF